MDAGTIARLEAVAATPFKRLSYTEAIEILEEVVRSKKKKFEFPVRLLCALRRLLPVAGRCCFSCVAAGLHMHAASAGEVCRTGRPGACRPRCAA